MSGVCGHEGRCLDWECPFTVCVGCPIAEALDAYGVEGKAESREQVMAALEAAIKEEERWRNARTAGTCAQTAT